ncbi:hypothetical protein GCM10027051_26050 [Niabella terrae]
MNINTLSQLNEYLNSNLDGAVDGVINGAVEHIKLMVEESVHSKIVKFLKATLKWVNRRDLFSLVSLSNNTQNRRRYLDPLINNGWIAKEYRKNATNPKQRYRITKPGLKLLKLISGKPANS